MTKGKKKNQIYI